MSAEYVHRLEVELNALKQSIASLGDPLASAPPAPALEPAGEAEAEEEEESATLADHLAESSAAASHRPR